MKSTANRIALVAAATPPVLAWSANRVQSIVVAQEHTFRAMSQKDWVALFIEFAQ